MVTIQKKSKMLTQQEKNSVYTWDGLTTSCKSTVIAKVRNKETKWYRPISVRASSLLGENLEYIRPFICCQCRWWVWLKQLLRCLPSKHKKRLKLSSSWGASETSSRDFTCCNNPAPVLLTHKKQLKLSQTHTYISHIPWTQNLVVWITSSIYKTAEFAQYNKMIST